MPNMVLMMPKDENELRHMLITAVSYGKGPIAVRYPRVQGLGVRLDPFEDLRPIPIGTWETIRDGRDVHLLAVGPNMLGVARDAADRLAAAGISAHVVNARFIKPLDERMLMELASGRPAPILTLEEGVLAGGFGAAVMEFYAVKGIRDVTVVPFGVPDRFIDHGSVKEQLMEAGLTADRIADEALALLPRHRQRASTGG